MKKLLSLVLGIAITLSGCSSFAATQYPISAPYQQFVDANGAPIAGGSVYTCQPGTTCTVASHASLKTTYTDSTGTSANANPIVLDSAGRANIWGTGFYKISVYDATGNLVKTSDNIPPTFNYVTPPTVPWVNVSTYGSIAAAVAALGSVNPAVLLVDCATTVSTSVTIPSNITLAGYNTGSISIASGQVLTVNGPFMSPGLYRFFSGSGTVTGLKEACPEWFGADNTGVADSTAAVNAAFIASGGNLKFSKGTYRGNFTFYTFGKVEGVGVGLTKLTPYNATDPIVTVLQGTTAYSYIQGLGFAMRDLIIDGGQNHTAVDGSATSNSFTTQHGIRLFGGTATGEPNSSIGQILIEHVTVTACGGHGIYFDGLNSGTANAYSQVAWAKLDNIVSTWNLGNGVRFAGSSYQTQITGGSLIEKNARGCAKPADETVLNERAQILIKAGNSGYPSVIDMGGGTTIQTGADGEAFTAVTGTYAAGISNHGGTNISVHNCWIESNDIGIASTSTIGSGFNIKDNYIKHSGTYGILLSAAAGVTIDGNNLIQDSVGGTGIKGNPVTPSNLSYVTIGSNKYVNFTTNRDLGSAIAYLKTKDYGEEALKTYTQSTTGVALTVDLSLGTVNYINLAHNITITLTNPKVGQVYTFYIFQGTTSNTVAWADTIKWSGNVAPTITTTNNRGDCIQLIYRSNGSFYELSRLTNIPT